MLKAKDIDDESKNDCAKFEVIMLKKQSNL